MLSEKFIDRVNNIIADRTFNFKGDIISGLECDIDLKLKFLGYKNMISIGEPTPYLRVGLTITDLKDAYSKIIFGTMAKTKRTPEELANDIKRQFYSFNLFMTRYIESVVNFFDSDENRVVIDEATFDFEIPDVVMEQKKSRFATRQVVRDIINLVKEKKSGFFQLPDDDFYMFENFPVEFSVELTLKKSKKIEGYQLNADYVPDEDVIEVLLIFNPDNLEQKLYDIVGALNEVITHELEHSLQNYKGELDMDIDSESLKPFEYYSQPHEIEAQVKGFRRYANMRKQPFDAVVKDWFNTHKDIHNLSDKETSKVIDQLLKYNGRF